MKKVLPFCTPAEFYQERDFSLKVSATFEFLRYHGGPLGRCLLLYVVPVPLLGFLVVTGVTILSASADTYARFVGTLVFTLPALLLGHLMLILTVYGYLLLRMDTPRREPVTPRTVGHWIRRRFLGALGAYVVLGVLLFLGFALLTLPGIWLSVPAGLFFIARLREDLSINDALVRAINLVKNNWWATLGLTLVMSFIGVIIPFGAQTLLSLLGGAVAGLVGLPHLFEYLVMGISSVSLVLYLLMSTLVLLAMAFQYFSLVERKDGVSIYALIDQLGGPAPIGHPDYGATVDDEEGEY